MRRFLISFFCVLSLAASAGTFSLDSVGSETKDGKTFILHEVGNNETLYSVSRKYEVPIYEIIKHNPPTEYGLDQGQVIRIPIPNEKEEKPSQEIALPAVIKNNEINSSESENQKVTEIPSVKQEEQIAHIVKQGETMFSISRLYDVSIEDLRAWNGLTSNNLSIGQELVVKPIVKNETNLILANSEDQTHVVKQSETLYSISKLYDVSVADLREWNDLITNEISIGQLLIVTKVDKAQKPTVIIEKPKVRMPADTIRTILKIDTAKYNVKPEKRTNFEEIYESGLAQEIEGTSGNRKYLALHRSAKAGTIMKIKNEMNDQEVFVRVIGPLPDTSVNKNLVVKISKAAYDRLGAIDPKFRVTVSYIP